MTGSLRPPKNLLWWSVRATKPPEHSTRGGVESETLHTSLFPIKSNTWAGGERGKQHRSKTVLTRTTNNATRLQRHRRQRYFGVGIVRSDPYEAMSNAALPLRAS